MSGTIINDSAIAGKEIIHVYLKKYTKNGSLGQNAE